MHTHPFASSIHPVSRRVVRPLVAATLFSLLTFGSTAGAAAPPTAPPRPERPARPAAPIAPPDFKPGGTGGAKPSPTPDTSMPKPQELVDRYIQVIGGADRLKQNTSRRATLKFETSGMGVAGADMTMSQRAPNLMMVVIDIPGMGMMRTGFDGTNGWSVDPMRGPMLLTGPELETMKRDAEFLRELKMLEPYKTTETVGLEDFNGAPAWKVRMVDKDDIETIAFFNKETGLLSGLTTTAQVMGGSVPTTTTFVEYKDFDGLTLAAVTEIAMMGQKQTLRLIKMEFDVVEDADFAPPAEIKTLLDAQGAAGGAAGGGTGSGTKPGDKPADGEPSKDGAKKDDKPADAPKG